MKMREVIKTFNVKKYGSFAEPTKTSKKPSNEEKVYPIIQGNPTTAWNVDKENWKLNRVPKSGAQFILNENCFKLGKKLEEHFVNVILVYLIAQLFPDLTDSSIMVLKIPIHPYLGHPVELL